MELRRSRDDRLERRVGDAAEPRERVPHLRLLRGDLLLVGQILETAAAAGRVVRARRFDPPVARLEHLGRERLREAALHLRDARPDEIAGQPAPHEDDEAVQPRDAVAAVRERVDAELELVALLDRRGHAHERSAAAPETRAPATAAS